MTSLLTLWKRQQGSAGNGGLDGAGPDDESGWWSPQAVAARYAIVTFLLLAFVLYFVGGYWHAQRRIRAGLAPLPYHAFLVRRQMQPRYNPYYGHGPESHPMQDQYAYPAPPPPYVPPPVYQPPQGASKVMADQHFNEGYGAHGAHGAPGTTSDGTGAAAPSASRQ